MADVLRQGVEITLLGIGLTFAALALLILMMVLLERLFRGTSPLQSEKSVAPARQASAGAPDEEIAAAIAVALLSMPEQGRVSAGLGASLERDRSAWWRRGQATQTGLSPSRKHGWKGFT